MAEGGDQKQPTASIPKTLRNGIRPSHQGGEGAGKTTKVQKILMGQGRAATRMGQRKKASHEDVRLV